MEAVECGAAALGIILAYWGRIVPLATLRLECGVSRDGSSASSVVKVARRHGMEAKGFSMSLDALEDLDTPYIVFWQFNHFLVVEGFGRGKVYLNDPAVGHRTVTFEEFDEGFTGVVLVMRPGPEFERGGHRPSVLTTLHRRLRGSYQAVLYTFLAGFLLVLPGLLIPAFTQIFLDHVLAQGRGEWLRPLFLAMLTTAVIQGALTAFQLRALRRLQLGLSVRMSSEFIWHLLRLPVGFYAQRYAGEVCDRNDLNDKVADVLSGQLATTLIQMVMMVFYAGLMYFYDPTLTLIGIGFALLNFLALRTIARRRVEANMRLLQEYGRVYGASIAGLQSMETIKASGQEDGFFARWAGTYARASNAQQALQLSNRLLGALPALLTALATTLVLVVGGFRVIDGAITIGMLVAFQGLMMGFLGPVNGLVSLGGTIQELQGDLGRIDDVLAYPPDPYAPERPIGEVEELGAVRLTGALEIRDVTFGYSPVGAALLEDFHLSIQPGQRVALVGGSGSGKSTVARLVCGLYEPWSGEILFDGRSRSDVPRHLMGNSFALVDQDIALFAGSLRANLTLWDDMVPEQNLVRACEDAAIYDVVKALPGGFDGELTEGGTNLSGGQRQRLEIARALVTDPTLLVLDEATSALDAATEQEIFERIRMRGCSCLLVAHRLSTIRDCDEILVLEQGVVVERGTHAELWKQQGVYADLLRSGEGKGLDTKAS